MDSGSNFFPGLASSASSICPDVNNRLPRGRDEKAGSLDDRCLSAMPQLIRLQRSDRKCPNILRDQAYLFKRLTKERLTRLAEVVFVLRRQMVVHVHQDDMRDGKVQDVVCPAHAAHTCQRNIAVGRFCPNQGIRRCNETWRLLPFCKAFDGYAISADMRIFLKPDRAFLGVLAAGQAPGQACQGLNSKCYPRRYFLGCPQVQAFYCGKHTIGSRTPVHAIAR